MASFIQKTQEMLNKKVNIAIPKPEYDVCLKHPEIFEKYNLEKKALTYFEYPLAEDCISKVRFIFTLGGDGTILWAHKVFNGAEVP